MALPDNRIFGSSQDGSSDRPEMVDWVENGRAPGDLVVVEQQPALSIAVNRLLPLCQWPAWPQYKVGDPKNAASFVCAK